MALSLVDADWTGVKQGSYQLWNGLWYWHFAEPAAEGVKYNIGTWYNAAQINKKALLGYDVPNPGYGGIQGFPGISWGNYDQSAPIVPIVPRRIDQINTLIMNLSFKKARPAASKGGPLHEFWVGETAQNSGSFVKLAEVGKLNAPEAEQIAFMNGGTPRGTFNDPTGRNWTVASNGTYHLARPTDNVPVQGLDYWHDYIAFLRGLGLIPAAGYFNGICFGIEPLSGPATWEYSYENIAYA